MNVRIAPSWKEALKEEFSKDYFQQLTEFVRAEYATTRIFPPGNRIFAAFDATPFDSVKVIILGQDPYHGEGQANGLCFSVSDGIPFPPSLLNIFKEVHDDTGSAIPPNGDLSRWADQGVLLLNATLTVRAHNAGSHQGKGWEKFTDEVIRQLADKREHLVFMLWGSYAIPPFGTDVTTPVTTLCLPRIFRKSPFHSSQCLPLRTRANPYQLVI